MKKFLAILLTLTLLLALTACNNKPTTNLNQSTAVSDYSYDDSNTSNPNEPNDNSTKTNNSTTTTTTKTNSRTKAQSNTNSNSSTSENSSLKNTISNNNASTNTNSNNNSYHVHSYSPATCTKPATCACGATSGSALGHNYGLYSIDKEATCSTDGLSTMKCTRCGDSYTKTIPAFGCKANNNGYCEYCGKAILPNAVLANYIIENGGTSSGSTYYISKSSDSGTTYIYCNADTKDLTFTYESNTSTGTTITKLYYKSGAERQSVTIDDYISGSKISGMGYIYTASYSISNDEIYSFTCDNPSYKSQVQTIAEQTLSLLFFGVSDILKDTGLNITLSSLGFEGLWI